MGLEGTPQKKKPHGHKTSPLVAAAFALGVGGGNSPDVDAQSRINVNSVRAGADATVRIGGIDYSARQNPNRLRNLDPTFDPKFDATFDATNDDPAHYTDREALHTYLIKAGDTLSTIAKEHDLQLRDILSVNPKITDPAKISVGQRITLPILPTRSTSTEDLRKSVTTYDRAIDGENIGYSTHDNRPKISEKEQERLRNMYLKNKGD